MTAHLTIARYLAARGLPVFPCAWRGPKAKSPLTANGFRGASAEADQIAAWWGKHPAALVGLPIPPGVVVVDTDQDADAETGEVLHGDDSLRAAGLLNLADAAAGLIVSTPSGGVHRWYTVPNTTIFSNTSHVNALANVDLRTGGKGYVIAPGCRYAVGEYRVIKGGLDGLGPMPARLTAALRKPEPTAAQRAAARILAGEAMDGFVVDHGAHRLSAKGRQFLERRLDGLFRRLIGHVAMAYSGTRHSAILRQGRTLAGFLHYRAWTPEQLAEALFDASVENGHVADDGAHVVRLAIVAAITDGAKNPLALEDRNAGRKTA